MRKKNGNGTEKMEYKKWNSHKKKAVLVTINITYLPWKKKVLTMGKCTKLTRLN
jgi:hypothetical protein